MSYYRNMTYSDMIFILFFSLTGLVRADCEKIRIAALKKIDAANHCKTHEDCRLFKSALTCKGQGIHKKTPLTELESLANDYGTCLSKQKPPQEQICTMDFISTASPCLKQKCQNNKDFYEAPYK